VSNLIANIESPQEKRVGAPREPSWFVNDFDHFSALSKREDREVVVDWNDRKPCLEDRTSDCTFDRHYIYHTAWAARVLARSKPGRHVDISSSLYFSAIASAFVPVEFYEFRQTSLKLDGLKTGTANLTALPFADSSLPSVSCMHVIEHIGLGRYGDAIDPNGDLKAIEELKRVTAPGGSLLFVVPIGRPRVVFNAHRIYSIDQIRNYFIGFSIEEFALVPDGRHNLGLVSNPSDDVVNQQNYGCGCFWLRRAA